MATRSTIAVQHEDGTVSQIYCHYDGYLEHNGKMLLEYYNTRLAAEFLVSKGALSVLAPRVTPDRNAIHNFEVQQNGVCVFYGRDRGEADCGPVHYSSVNNYLDSRASEGYNYLYQAGAWFYVEDRGSNFKLVSRDLATTEEE